MATKTTCLRRYRNHNKEVARIIDSLGSKGFSVFYAMDVASRKQILIEWFKK